MSDTNFSFVLRPSSSAAALTVTVSVDQSVIFGPCAITQEHTVTVPLTDESGSHCLHIDLEGKMPEHTQLDSDHNIVADAVIEVCDPVLDATDMRKVFFKLSRYSHNTNNTTEPVDQPFYGIMGCNGRVTLPFETPAYLWLLDNM